MNLKKFKFLEITTYGWVSSRTEGHHTPARTHDSNSCRCSWAPSEPACSGTSVRTLLLLTVGRAFRGYSAAQPTWGETSTEMQCCYCCGIQNTDTHDLLKKLTLSQAKPVQHPRRRGVNHCPPSKMEEASKSPEQIFIHLPYLLLPTIRMPS